MADRTCITCGRGLPAYDVASGARKCSACKWSARERVPCATCGGPTGWALSQRARASKNPRCQPCRRANPAHGRTRYTKGCRCDVCREEQAAWMRDYAARRRAEGNPIQRPRDPRECAHCGAEFLARRDQPGMFCGMACARLAQGWDPGVARDRFRPSKSLRRVVSERDGWTCQICGLPVDPGAKLRTRDFPSLDHIVPRSRGGSDGPENLRLAHMGCNADRGAPDPQEAPRVPV